MQYVGWSIIGSCLISYIFFMITPYDQDDTILIKFVIQSSLIYILDETGESYDDKCVIRE